MAVRVDCVWLELYVTYGNVDVDRFRRLRALEEGLILTANPRPDFQPLTRWRGKTTNTINGLYVFSLRLKIIILRNSFVRSQYNDAHATC